MSFSGYCSVLLRQNPHNVHEWHKRVQLYKDKPREVNKIKAIIKNCLFEVTSMIKKYTARECLFFKEHSSIM